jgi:hypothetical protein
MRKWHSQGHLIAYSQSLNNEDGTPEEGTDAHGIVYNHAYGMLRIEDLTQQHGL